MEATVKNIATGKRSERKVQTSRVALDFKLFNCFFLLLLFLLIFVLSVLFFSLSLLAICCRGNLYRRQFSLLSFYRFALSQMVRKYMTSDTMIRQITYWLKFPFLKKGGAIPDSRWNFPWFSLYICS